MSSVGRQRGREGAEPESDTPDERGRNADEADMDEADMLDRVFGVLSNRRRRQVIEYLRERDGTATVGELAEHIASEEDDTPIKQLSSSDRKRVYVSLYQNHLPVIADANIVAYDKNRKTVRLLDGAAKLEPYLDDENDPAQARVPVGVALVVSSVVLLGAFQVGPFAGVPPTAWTALGLVGLLGVACFELYTHVLD